MFSIYRQLSVYAQNAALQIHQEVMKFFQSADILLHFSTRQLHRSLSHRLSPHSGTYFNPPQLQSRCSPGSRSQSPWLDVNCPQVLWLKEVSLWWESVEVSFRRKFQPDWGVSIHVKIRSKWCTFSLCLELLYNGVTYTGWHCNVIMSWIHDHVLLNDFLTFSIILHQQL